MSKISETPLVSINIPVYKCEKFIYRCLESVKNQTYSNLEIILVNDCTPDNSVAIIEEYIIQNPDLNIKLIHLEVNQGLSIVRNTAIKHSSGKYIYMLDSDDYIAHNCIEKLVENSEKYKCEITVGETICEYENSGERKQMFKIKSDKNFIEGNEKIFSTFIDGKYPVIGPNKLYLNSFIKNNNLQFVKGLFSQDELWAFHCAEKLTSISFISDITYIYYMNSASTIFNKTKKNFENYLTILSYFEKSYKASESVVRKKLIKKKIIHFRNMVMIMQWKTLKSDKEYFQLNYSRMKKLPSLNFLDYFDNFYKNETKKLSFLQSLPTNLGVKLFIKRYG